MTQEWAQRVNDRGTTSYRDEASYLIQSAGDVVIVERGVPRWFVIGCPCGCGDEVPVNLDPRTGAAWRIYRTARGLSLFPSIWREGGCRSHFIVWNGDIYLFGKPWPTAAAQEAGRIDELVLPLLKTRGGGSIVDLAEALGEVPWAIQAALERLIYKGVIRERKSERGYFELR